MARYVRVSAVLLLLTVSWDRAWSAEVVPGGAPRAREIAVGAARIDVTPTEPIRLTGYASRTNAHVGVEQKLWAKALAIGSDADGPAVLLTLDNCGVSEETWREVRTRLGRSAGIRPDRVVLASSHTHSGPATRGWAPNIFVRDLSPAELGAIDRYTDRLIEQLEAVALEALRGRRPGRLSWSQGTAGFAANRRTRGGPVDLALPVLKAEGTNGALLALVANYACHCTTLGGEFNRACGDWAGYAQEAIERAAPGAVGLVTIGCGADANPSPRGGADGGLALARRHGDEVGAEVRRLLAMNFTPLTNGLSSAAREIQLPFGPPFTRDQWQARSTNSGIVGYHARRWLARLDRGETVPPSLYYPITAWHFGDELGLVFLPGEVVVDYALRLKRELDGPRLWVTGYANYVPCYIPSRRILAEGGYEAEESLWYYDRPARISTNAENQIVETTRELLPASFRTDPARADLPPPREPAQALGLFRLPAELDIELVAAEPLVQSPVAIDWDAAGRMWVCEMYDYPTGVNPPPDVGRKYGEPVRVPPGGFTPGGRVKVLTDVDGDGRMDRAEVFLDRIPFPTGVMPWGKGALICAAPDILYAEDTNGDGRADVVRTNVTGFATHNFQARVNGFRWGLDGWLHGSSGLFGGKVRVLATGREVDLSGRDFRYRPETGEIEAVAGISQMGRVRDDFDQWYGNDNSTLLWQYPIPDRYLRRNPAVVYPEPRVQVAPGAALHRVHPASRTLERFNDPQMANIVTSACGPEIYRDDWLGAAFAGNAFICEPVHNLVRRLVLAPSGDGVTVMGRRVEEEGRGEFLASTDNWFRPVQARTGPDGALYVVDMYRFVVEHPRWIPPERLRELDVRAGADRGRVYRIVDRRRARRPARNLTRLDDAALARAMDTANGPTRDLVHRELLSRGATVADAGKAVLRDLSGGSSVPGARAQAIAALAGLAGTVDRRVVRDADAGVRRVALRAAEGALRSGALSPGLAEAVLAAGLDPDPGVRLQAALTLGELNDPRASGVLASLANESRADRWMRAAVLSSATGRAGRLLEAVLAGGGGTAREEWMGGLIATAMAGGRLEDRAGIIRALAGPATPSSGESAGEVWRIDAMVRLVEAMQRSALGWDGLVAGLDAETRSAAERMRGLWRQAEVQVVGTNVPGALRGAFIRLLGALDAETSSAALAAVLARADLAEWHGPAVEALGRSRRPQVAATLLGRWSTLAPSLRARALDVLLGRPEWMESLVAALERGAVRPSELSASQRQRLLGGSGEALRVRARRVLVEPRSVAGGVEPGTAREELFRKFSTVGALVEAAATGAGAADAGRAERGAATFDRLCASCHRVRGHGFDVGPNLAEFAGKSVDDFLLAILDPNAGVNPNFLAYAVETRDGRSLAGVVRDETASSLTVLQAGGVRETVLRADLVSLRAGDLSLMPEGLAAGMTPAEMADLVVWLRGGRVPVFGTATVEQAAAARAAFEAGRPARGITVSRAVERLPYPSWLGRWPLAYCRQTAGQERLEWVATAGEVGADTVVFRFPAAMGFHSQAAGGFALRVNGSAPVSFEVALADREWTAVEPAVGGRAPVRMRYAVREAHAEDSCGVLEVEVPRALVGADGVGRFEVAAGAVDSQRWFGLYLVGP